MRQDLQAQWECGACETDGVACGEWTMDVAAWTFGRFLTGIKPSEPVDEVRKLAFEEQKREGLVLAFRARTVAVCLVSVLLMIIIPAPRIYYFLSCVGVFFLLGLIPYFLRKKGFGSPVLDVIFIALDVALITIVILVPVGVIADTWPIQTRARFPDFLYLLLYLAGSALSFSPVIVWVTGILISLSWGIGILIIYTLPDTITSQNAASNGFSEQALSHFLPVYLHPNYVGFNGLLTQVVLILIISFILASAISRARRFMTRQIDSELERESLSRFFSPDVIDRISNVETLRHSGGTHDAAILFVDIVGFTGLAETMQPQETIVFLRDFHNRMANRVFEHSGTLDKYLGDGLMATFGTFESGDDDARRALHCALDMVDVIESWNKERSRTSLPAIEIAVGVHYGPVIAGDVGNGRRMEFTVVGDSVNVASRLERVTRDHGAPVAFSGDLVRAAGIGQDNSAYGWGLEACGTISVRGRKQPLDLWVARSHSKSQ